MTRTPQSLSLILLSVFILLGCSVLSTLAKNLLWCECLPPDLGPTAAGGSNNEYVNLRDVSQQHRGADTSLESLYGDTAVWIQANNGRMGRRQAASLWRLSQAS